MFVFHSCHSIKMKKIRGVRPNQIPDEILHNEALNQMITRLPSNYDFEIHKTIAKIREFKAKRVGLQFPEGLQMFACVLCDVIKTFGELEECIIMADVVYGACCIEDLTADQLRLDLLVHYGHSCLIPINETCMKTLYVFVDIHIDVQNLVDTIVLNFPDPATPIALITTIQFVQGTTQAKAKLDERGYTQIATPQTKPRAVAEVLGCTSPTIKSPIVISVSDGRFHLEAAMIHNPHCQFFRYDPYQNKLLVESYDLDGMKARRSTAIQTARQAKHVGLIMGTLGRQGSPYILKQLETVIQETGKECTLFLMTEVNEEVMRSYTHIDTWIQIACPRLSIDWGNEFSTPLLNPYEAFVAYKNIEMNYPMDNYSYEGGAWSVYNSKKLETVK